MDSGVDGDLFGHDDYAADGHVDIYYKGSGPIEVDATQNGVGALNVSAGNLVTVELKKPLNSGDVDGKDITWTVGGIYDLVIAWDTNGGGSSGGNTNHKSVTPIAYTVLISE
jgi:hypothetical protein